MTPTTATGLTLPLGSTPDGAPVTLDLDLSPNTLLTGPTGSGKTVFIRHLVRACSAAGVATVVIDPIRRGAGFRALPVGALVTDPVEVIYELESIASEISRRHHLFRRFNVSRWQELPEEVRHDELVQPVMVFIDEYAALVKHHPPRKGAEHAKLKEAWEHNAQADLIMKLTGSILREGRYSGFHLAISDVRADLNSIAPSMRGHLHNVIMTLRPGFALRETPVAMAFGVERIEEVLAAAQEGQGAAYGDAVIATPAGGLQRFNLPYSE